MSAERQLPEGWQWVTFGAVAREVTESTRTPIEDGFERYIGLDHFDPDSLSLKRWGMIEEDNPTFTKVFRAGQLLFGRRRAYQRKAAIADFDGICSGDIIVIEALPERLLPDLLPFVVQSDGFWENAIHTSAGSLSPRTKWANLAAYEFPLPPLDEQHRVAEILWAVEKTSEEWESSLGELRLARQILLNDLVSPSRMSSLKIYYFSQLTVGRKTQNGLYKPDQYYGRGIGIVHMGDIFAHDVITREVVKQQIELDASEAEQFTLIEGDLLFARRSIVADGAGKCALVGQLTSPLAFESSIIRARPDTELIVPMYLALWFQSIHGKKAVRRISRNSSIFGIASTDLQKIQVAIPPISAQHNMVTKITAFDTQAGRIISHIEQNTRLKQQLIQQLLQNGSNHV